MNISEIFKNRPLALAPMAGVTDAAFRAVCRDCGADITYTEMVSSRALVYQDSKTASLLIVFQTRDLKKKNAEIQEMFCVKKIKTI